MSENSTPTASAILGIPATPELLRGRTALVTGAASGIGQAIALAYARAGAKVLVTDRSEADCQETMRLIEELGGEGWSAGLDVTDMAACQALAAQGEGRWGQIDTLVNNAGVIIRQGIDHPEASSNLRKVFDVNVYGLFNVVQAWLADLRATRGRIVNITSGAAFIAQGGAFGYSPSKAAVRMATQTLALDLAPDGIRVNAIAPGVIHTPMTEATRSNPERLERFMQRIPSGRVGRPDEIAGAAVFLASDLASYVNGATLPVDGGTIAV